MHFQFLEQELKALVNSKTPVAGVIRQTAAQLRNQIDGDLPQWQPMKLLRTVLDAAQKYVTPVVPPKDAPKVETTEDEE